MTTEQPAICRHCRKPSSQHRCNDHGDGPARCKNRDPAKRLIFSPIPTAEQLDAAIQQEAWERAHARRMTGAKR